MGIQINGVSNKISSGSKIDFPGSVGVAGTLTYEDVANVDSVGLITARTGINIGPTAGVAGTFFADGSYVTAGVVTATTFYGSGANLTGIDTDLVADTSPQLGGNLDTNSKNIVFGDSSGTTVNRLTFGGQADLKLYHDGTNSVITNATGDLYINNNADTIIKPANDLFLKPQDGENGISVIGNGAVELYHDNTKTAWTHASGFNIKGKTTSDNTELIITGNEGQPASILMSADDGDDNADHWRMYSNTDNSFTLNSYAGGSYQSILKGTSSRSIELNYQGSKKLETVSAGVYVYGDLVAGVGGSGNFSVGDSRKIMAGSANDIQIFHDGSHSYIEANNTGSLIVGTVHDAPIFFPTNNTNRAKLTEAGHFIPVVNNSYDLGSSSERWRNIYTNDLHLSNKGSSNVVDGTWGDWTLQEGESDVYMINNRSGKKFRIKMEEV